jgi:hypothetical protein
LTRLLWRRGLECGFCSKRARYQLERGKASNMNFAIAVLTLFLVFVWVPPAYAYLDPGTGGMMLQLLLGGVAGIGVLGRLYWSRFRARVGLRERKTDSSQ